MERAAGLAYLFLPSRPTSMIPSGAFSINDLKWTPARWTAFCKQYKAEMAAPAARHDLALLAALSHTTHFSVGCYCEQESRCHRSVLRTLLADAGALLR